MSPLEASDIAADFHRALARLNRPGWRKLADPGVGVFLQRWRARRADEPSLRQVSLFFGESMQVALPEVISEQIHAYGLFDPEVSWLALCAVEQGDTVFDVGAHFGYFTLLFSALAGPSALATVLLLVSQAPERRLEWVAALSVTMLVCAVVLLLAERLQQLVGERVINAFERLMGLILVSISVEMMLRGIKEFVRTWPS